MTGQVKWVKVPLRLGLLYLVGTFIVFVLVGETSEVGNPSALLTFVLATWVLFYAGYRAYSPKKTLGHRPRDPEKLARALGLWVSVSGVYYIAYGIVYMAQHGIADPSALAAAILNPGASYQSKFGVFEANSLVGFRNPLAQVLTVLSVLSLPLVPFLIVGWEKISFIARTLGLLGIVSFGLFFLGIGTMKGLADLAIFAGAGLLIRVQIASRVSPDRGKRARYAAVLGVFLAGCALAGYMAVNQYQRAELFGTEDKLDSSPVIAAVVGPEVARGLASVVGYPTHGYLGLSHSLSVPFEWSAGRGSSIAVDSYAVQYLGVESAFESTYPSRAESATGWPALLLWSTAYPWIASDITFVGAALVMFVIGALLRKTWVESVTEFDLVAMLVFSQLVFFIAYLPANNQIGLSRQSLIAAVCIGIVYLWTRSSAGKADKVVT